MPLPWIEAEARPVAALETPCGRLLRAAAHAGARRGFVVVGHGKWDIPAFIGDGRALGLDVAYTVIRDSPGTPWTIDRAFPFLQDDVVVFGFPDILFHPGDALSALVDRQTQTGADVVLGLFPAESPERVDMVAHDAHGRVSRIEVKPPTTELEMAWILAAWAPSFTAFLHEFVAHEPTGRERYVGDVLIAALSAGLRLETVPFPGGRFRDLGTPADLVTATRERW